MPQIAYPKIGKYITKRIIRSSGSADLYECLDPDLKCVVAVKLFNIKNRLLRKLPYSRESWEERFVREARLLAQIDHPHVIQVRELSNWDGKPFYVMPFVKHSLLYEAGLDGERKYHAPEVRDAPLARAVSLKRSVEILYQLSSALAAFHGRGLVHRDIKPANVLLTKKENGLVKLCDPGMVKYPDFEESQAGYWIGSDDYIAPEQKRSATHVQASADIYAMGVMGFRLLTGELPAGVIENNSNGFENVPDGLYRLIMDALSAKPENRPQNALEFMYRIAPIRAALQRQGEIS